LQRVDGLRALSVLPSGPKPPNPQELLGRPAFGALLHQAQGQFDVIIVDTPAASENADALTIAARCRAALVVARKDLTTAGPVSRMAGFMQQGGTRIVGSVMNNG
jgi:receptor protein-tyrosine kinase